MSEVKTRPPIAAMIKGPGPGKYSLPSTIGTHGHDATKSMNPAFTFGLSLPSSIVLKSVTPGPAYALDSSITRNGKDGTPKYSMAPRAKATVRIETPAPGAYSPEKVPIFTQKNAPAYSMGSRTLLRKRDATPGPNSYTLKSTVGQAPSYSMTGRSKIGSFAEDLARTPGAGTYSVPNPDAVHSKSPAYTMLGRSVMPGDATKKPGPGAHSPERVTITQKRSPAYSLGIKHSEFIAPLIID